MYVANVFIIPHAFKDLNILSPITRDNWYQIFPHIKSTEGGQCRCQHKRLCFREGKKLPGVTLQPPHSHPEPLQFSAAPTAGTGHFVKQSFRKVCSLPSVHRRARQRQRGMEDAPGGSGRTDCSETLNQALFTKIPALPCNLNLT